MPSFSFVVFTYNSSDLIQTTLRHLKKTIDNYQIENEILLVDNNSNDNTIEIVNEFSKQYDLEIRIINNSRQGLAYSRIEGVKAASKEYICFIDDDNFVHPNWTKVLTETINSHNPDVIGCSTIGISSVELPDWWEKYKQYYACGKRYSKSGFLENPLHKMWGAGLTVKRKFAEPALLRRDLLCTGRIGKKQMTGEDAELNYRVRLLGGTFYNCNELVLDHFMRPHRLNKNHLKKTFQGNGLAAINLDLYKYLITNNLKYKLIILALLILIAAPYLTWKHKSNYYKYIIPRFKFHKERIAKQQELKMLFQPI